MDSHDEDGEIKDEGRHHPLRSREEHDDDEFSMSSYDGDQADSLVIKPPQAVALHRDKKEKREKRDRHRHKGERHKDRHRTRERGVGHEERRREHRRHRERDAEQRREAKRHDKRSRERSGSKHERPVGDLRNKLDKERKLYERGEQARIREKGREEYYIDDRDIYEQRQREHSRTSGQVLHHRERRLDDHAALGPPSLMGLDLSPRQKSEKEKRMERFMLAEEQKKMTQKEADARRQKREEERREEKRMEVLRQRAEESMLRNAARNQSPSQRGKKRRKHPMQEEPETVELISDDEEEEKVSEEEVEEEEEEEEEEEAKYETKKKRRNEEENEEVEEEEEKEQRNSSTRSASSGPTSDSESSSNTSSDDDEDDGEENDEEDEAEDNKEVNNVAPPLPAKKISRSDTRSGSSTNGDSTDDEQKDVNSEEEFDKKDNYMEDSPEASPAEIKEQLPSYFPAIMGCRSVDEFECLNRIEEGTYGVVYRAREKSTNEIVALKRLKMEKEKEGFPITSLREVNTLLKGQHENIVTVREIVVGSNMDKIYIVMDYVEHDLKSLMETMRKKKQAFTIGEVKTLMIQLLRAVHHLHDNWILHRDLKTSNLLLSHRGILKVGDFGLAREYGSPLKQYTPIVVTLWYRAPELLLGTKEYSCPIDVWSVGCIFGELLGMEPMFPGKSEIDQLNKIFKDLGTPSDKIWPGYSQMPVIKKTQFAYYPYNHLKERFKTRLSIEGFKLLNSFLTYNPEKRITCSEGLKHDYFFKEEPAPIDPAMFPTWPAKSENPGGRAKKGLSPKPPSGGKEFKALGDGEDESIAGFFLGGAPSSGPGFTLKF